MTAKEEVVHWKARALRAEKELDEIQRQLRLQSCPHQCEYERCGCCAASASELVAGRMMAEGNSHE